MLTSTFSSGRRAECTFFYPHFLHPHSGRLLSLIRLNTQVRAFSRKCCREEYEVRYPDQINLITQPAHLKRAIPGTEPQFVCCRSKETVEELSRWPAPDIVPRDRRGDSLRDSEERQ